MLPPKTENKRIVVLYQWFYTFSILAASFILQRWRSCGQRRPSLWAAGTVRGLCRQRHAMLLLRPSAGDACGLKLGSHVTSQRVIARAMRKGVEAAPGCVGGLAAGKSGGPAMDTIQQ